MEEEGRTVKRKPKFETRIPKDNRMPNGRLTATVQLSGNAICKRNSHSDFGLLSDFELRLSDLIHAFYKRHGGL
jgi:hypothetical protein